MELQPKLQGSVLAVRGGSTVYEESAGLADRTTGTPCGPRTRFQIASVSKQFTAAAILLLVDRGTVALDDEVGRWIDGCPPSWQPITVHQLLTHTSCLGHWGEYPDIDLCAWSPPEEVVKAFQQAGPLFPVGSRWHYSSPAYGLLAHIVERASDRPYREFLSAELFEPLDLRDTFAGSAGDRTNVALGYLDGEPTPSFELDSVGMGAGDVSSTTGDLLRWDQALAAGQILSDETRRLMFHPHAEVGAEYATDPGHAYAYGWSIAPIAGQPARYHSGGNAGFRTFNTWFPESDAYVIVLCNDDNADSHDLTIQIAKAVLFD